MTISITRRTYWGFITVACVLVLSTGLFTQSRPAHAAGSVTRDLNLTLGDLTRIAPATSQDLANLQQQSGMLHRVTFWRGEKAQQSEMATALRRNLQFAVPDLTHDAQASGGSISTTFKLYNDLTVVCESLDSLLPQGSREGKTHLAALNNDLIDMNRLREELSSYIQRTAASIESKNPQLVSSAGRPKKVIVDDNVPEKPASKKHRTSNQ